MVGREPENALSNSTNTTADKEDMPGPGELVLGILLTLMGAATLAFSMSIQRYALAHPKPTIPYCGLQLKKKWVWAFGLLLYAAANGFKARAAPPDQPCTVRARRTGRATCQRTTPRRAALAPIDGHVRTSDTSRADGVGDR